MGVTNRDASLTTINRQNVTLYGYRLSTANATNKPEQGSAANQGGPSAAIPLNVTLGAVLVGQTAGACQCTPGGPSPNIMGNNTNVPSC
jgi:hypothetical protein